MIPKSYKKKIAEGKGILIFSIILAISIRVAYYIFCDSFVEPSISEGYLWKLILPLFSNPLYAIIGNSLVTATIAVLLAHCNTKYALIRGRTFLPPALCILLFSCHPSFIIMSSDYIGAISIVLIILGLFGSYHQKLGQAAAFKVSFILALGSLFSPVILLYFPVLLIALGMIRCFSFKSMLASLLGLIFVYFPAFSFYLFTGNLEGFLYPFTSVDFVALSDIPLRSYNTIDWGILGLSVILVSIILGDNYINLYKDKIRIRTFLSLLSLITIFAILLSLLFNINATVNIYIALATGSLLLSHFFALAEKKGVVVVFYIALTFYFAICLFHFLFV